MSRQKPDRIILFDGVCNLCNSSVQFVIKRDPNMLFRYAALQGGFSRRKLAEFNEIESDSKSVVFIDDDKIYFKSDAILRIAGYLTGAWPLMKAFLIFPRFIRDGLYDFIGRNRYKWFGRQESCMIPDPKLKELFMD